MLKFQFHKGTIKTLNMVDMLLQSYFNSIKVQLKQPLGNYSLSPTLISIP